MIIIQYNIINHNYRLENPNNITISGNMHVDRGYSGRAVLRQDCRHSSFVSKWVSPDVLHLPGLILKHFFPLKAQLLPLFSQSCNIGNLHRIISSISMLTVGSVYPPIAVMSNDEYLCLLIRYYNAYLEFGKILGRQEHL